LSDAEAAKAEAAFDAHLAHTLPQLPASLRAFAETVDIHDGRIRGVTLDRGAAALRLALRCGDLQQGYFDVDLEYGGVDLDRLDVPMLAVIAEDPRSEALYLEVDVVAPGRYVHRWLWWRYRRELDVEFRELVFHTEPRASREFPKQTSKFVDIAAPAV
jgi:hypothetical protein